MRVSRPSYPSARSAAAARTPACPASTIIIEDVIRSCNDVNDKAIQIVGHFDRTSQRACRHTAAQRTEQGLLGRIDPRQARKVLFRKLHVAYSAYTAPVLHSGPESQMVAGGFISNSVHRVFRLSTCQIDCSQSRSNPTVSIGSVLPEQTRNNKINHLVQRRPGLIRTLRNQLRMEKTHH